MDAVQRLLSCWIPSFNSIRRATSLQDLSGKLSSSRKLLESSSDLACPLVNDDSARTSPTNSIKTPFSSSPSSANLKSGKWRFSRREQLMLLVTLLCIGQVSFMQRASTKSTADALTSSSRRYYEKEPGEPEWSPAELPKMQVLEASEDKCADALEIRKVALLFLTTGDLYHERAWKLWFQSAEKLMPRLSLGKTMCDGDKLVTDEDVDAAYDACLGHNVTNSISRQHLFSVYIHAPPSFRGYRSHSLWRGHLVRNRIQTQWGAHSLVEATRHLIWEAFKDPLNQRFILLSESDIPLYDPLTLYQQIMTEKVSRLDTCKHSKTSPWRWDPKMETARFKFHHWRKSPQWIALTRSHVQLVLKDEEVYRNFERYCWSSWDDQHNRWHRECFSDEHYFATLLAVEGKESEGVCESRGVAFTNWEEGSAHPTSYKAKNITSELIKTLRSAQKSATGQPTEACDWQAAEAEASKGFMPIGQALSLGGKSEEFCADFWKVGATFTSVMPSTCFLTARKFPKESAAAVLELFKTCRNNGVQMVGDNVCEEQIGAFKRASGWLGSFTG